MWTVLWILWGLGFAGIEGVAIARDAKGGTLSEHFRLWFRTDTKRGRTAWIVTSGVFFAWFLIHVATPPGYVS